MPPTPPSSRAEGLSTVATTNEIFAGDADYPAGPYGHVENGEESISDPGMGGLIRPPAS